MHHNTFALLRVYEDQVKLLKQQQWEHFSFARCEEIAILLHKIAAIREGLYHDSLRAPSTK